MQFRTPEAALQVYRVMHGRQFDGRTVVCVFTDPVHFAAHELGPVDGEPALTTTLLVRNMVYAEELDDDFIPDVVTEMSAYGRVLRCVVRVSPADAGVAREERVRVLVRFASAVGAMQALVNVDGRTFGGKEVAAHLYDDLRWARDDLDRNDKAEPPLPLRCLLSNTALPPR